MPLVIDTEPGQVATPQRLRANLADGRLLLVFSGVAIVDFKGASAEWNRDSLFLALNTTPVSSSDRTFVEDQGAPLVTLNSIFDRNTAINAGFAVDSCRPILNLFPDFIFIECRIAVRDSDAFLFRAGYHVTVTGRIQGATVARKPFSRSLLEEAITKHQAQATRE